MQYVQAMHLNFVLLTRSSRSSDLPIILFRLSGLFLNAVNICLLCKPFLFNGINKPLRKRDGAQTNAP